VDPGLRNYSSLAVNNSATPIASHAYTLDAVGHRLSISELSGHGELRLRQSLPAHGETIAGDPNGINGAANLHLRPGRQSQADDVDARTGARGPLELRRQRPLQGGRHLRQHGQFRQHHQVYDFSCELSQPILAEVLVLDRSEPILVRRPESPSHDCITMSAPRSE
jgi:hypothetical protein